MNKRFVAILALGLLIGFGAGAQLMIGVSGALHMDEQMGYEQIIANFQEGNGIFYGPSVELGLGKLGLGFSFNASLYTIAYLADLELPSEFMDYDVGLYAAYHLLGTKSLLDPFGEIGYGMIAQDYANETDDPDTENPLAASMYWYGALGLGVNLGPIGLFGKFAYNNYIRQQLDAKDVNGDPLVIDGVTQTIPYYGPWDEALGEFVQYVPKFRFTAGVKLIL